MFRLINPFSFSRFTTGSTRNGVKKILNQHRFFQGPKKKRNHWNRIGTNQLVTFTSWAFHICIYILKTGQKRDAILPKSHYTIAVYYSTRAISLQTNLRSWDVSQKCLAVLHLKNPGAFFWKICQAKRFTQKVHYLFIFFRCARILL